MSSQIISLKDVIDISDQVLMSNDKVHLTSADLWKSFKWRDFRAFCHFKARYGIPTLELIDFLHQQINKRTTLDNCIEIGSGAGDLGYHLGIKMTDSKLQDDLSIKLSYAVAMQPTIKYPDDVEKIEATEAVYKYKPKIVIASWVTTYSHKEVNYNSNPFGVRELEILGVVDTFILIGNLDTHGNKPIMNIKHEEYYFDWLVSRAKNQYNNRIWIWDKNE